jgi:glutamate transport system permease protein
VRIVVDNLDLYLKGMGVTVALTLLSFAAAMVAGTVVATFRVSPVPPLRAAGTLYVESLRNAPLAVLFVRYPAFTSSVIVLGAYTSTFVAETVRSGVNTVATGQAEAARALGLRFSQVLGLVVLPQAFRTVVAPLGSVFIALIKNSSLASLVSVAELTFEADRLNTHTARPIPVFLGAAAAYLVLALPAGWLVGQLERRTAVKR